MVNERTVRTGIHGITMKLLKIIGKSLTFYVSFYGFLGTIYNTRKEARKGKKTKKEGRKGEKRRLSKLSYATALRS